MKPRSRQQYTIRDIPPDLDTWLRKRARATGKSLNRLTLETLRLGAKLRDVPKINHELASCIGSWVEDPAFDEAIRMQDQVDPDLWK
ncbi:MAG TPA: hypothetical protein VI895_02230 [Bdellovibrionota bacterium]|nr:hypothetical protein [Bdellovibrionota bacterium]